MRAVKLAYYARSLAALTRELDGARALVDALWPRGRTLRLHDGMSIELVDLLDVLVYVETAVEDAYGLEAVRGEAPTIVDVGAGFGAFALTAARRFPAARVLAVEPGERSFAALSRNLHRNRLMNATALHAAVGLAPAYRVNDDGSAAQVTVTSSAESTPRTVRGVTLDELLPPGDIELLKIDCEGAEADVLASASPGTLGRVRRIALEYHVATGAEPSDLVESLETSGFTVRTRADRYDNRLGYLEALRR